MPIVHTNVKKNLEGRASSSDHIASGRGKTQIFNRTSYAET